MRLSYSAHHNSDLQVLKPSAMLQTKDFDISNQSPCGHGVVICLSISGGPALDFRDLTAHAGSNGAAVQKQDVIWVDVMLDDEVMFRLS